MTPVDIMAAAALIVPGAAAVRLWDYFGSRRERSQLGMLGWSIFVSAVEYAVLVSFGGDVAQLFSEDGGLVIQTLLAPKIMRWYLGILGVNCLAGSLFSVLFHNYAIQGLLSRVVGRTFYETAWTETAASSVNHWVVAVLRTGERVRGWLSSASGRPENGYISLEQASPWNPNDNDWMPDAGNPTLTVAIADVAHLYRYPPPERERTDDGQAEQANTSVSDSHQTRRGIQGNDEADLTTASSSATLIPEQVEPMRRSSLTGDKQ